MDLLTDLVRIKDLIIFQNHYMFSLIEKYVKNSEQKGVYIGELSINPYIYESRNFELSFLVNYIQSINNIVCIFRDIYDDYIYNLKLSRDIPYTYHDNNFHMIFDTVNNEFNLYLSDQYLFEDFGIYYSETSVETIMALYKRFNNTFVYIMKELVDINKLNLFIQQKSIKHLPYIYNKIFEQFEYIYLPFY